MSRSIHKAAALSLLMISAGACTNAKKRLPFKESSSSGNSASFPERERAQYETTGRDFMVVSQGDATSRAARDILRQGGSVIDAAAAASFTIAVERPQSTGIAGGGFMVIHLRDGNQDIAIDFRERAPLTATETMFQDASGQVVANRSTKGSLAVGVPGMVAGVIDAHKRYGKLPLATVLRPAIALAEKGVVVYPHLAESIASAAKLLSQTSDAKVFFDAKGEPLKVGALMRQPNLAKVLRAIASKGRDGFYRGWVAAALVAQQKKSGGLIRQEDLDAYKVEYRKPVTGTYGPYQVLSMPPPSSGGVHVVEILNIVEGFPLAKQGAFTVESIHETAAAMQLAYYDRSKYLGDSDFVKVPLAGLTSDAYAAELRKSIDISKAKRMTDIASPQPSKYESPETTHFSIADKDGNVVASTQTINGIFGSGVVVPGTGMVLNNEMDDFSAKPGVPNAFGVVGGTANAILPQKRPLSSMSPTIVKKDGNPVLALGSPSGSQIITCVTLTILNHLTYEMPLYDAVTAIRYHHQWTPDELTVEEPGFPPETAEKLTDLGYKLNRKKMNCRVQAIAFEKDGLRGVSDPRGEGRAASESSK